MDEAPKANWFGRRNWWKIGFFAMLIAFEGAREAAVFASDQRQKVAALATVESYQGFTTAEGRWTRTDGGDRLNPSATEIQCTQQDGTCVEATASTNDGYLNTPSVDTYQASFTPQTITYENGGSLCANYRVEIDLAMRKVFALRTLKDDAGANKLCANLERRVAMTLADGYQEADGRPADGHFTPLLDMVITISKLF